MTQEDKQLLLVDLCGRLPYRVKIELTWWVMGEGAYINTTLEPDHIEQLLNDEDGDIEIKPYLRPMSGMTEEETVEYCDLQDKFIWSSSYPVTDGHALFDWLNAHHFDYRGLIEKGLAIAVAEDNNLYNNIKDCDYEKEKSE